VSEATDEWERQGWLRKYLRHFMKVRIQWADKKVCSKIYEKITKALTICYHYSTTDATTVQ
jgi:hypothetical protein